MWMRLTDREADYAKYILDGWEHQRPAIIDRNVITFVGEDGRTEFLSALADEVAYDQPCGVRTAGLRLLTGLDCA
jgi:hypothetical protein